MKNILTIFKKEWDRVIRDKRLIITVMILPGLMIFLVYTFMGSAMQNMYSDDVYDIAIVNPQVEFANIYETYEIASTATDEEAGSLQHLNVIEIDEDQISQYQLMIDDEEWDILISIDEGINDYTGAGEKPIVTLYSNPNNFSNSSVVNSFSNYVYYYRDYLSNELFGDTDYFGFWNIGTELNEETVSGTILSSLLPMLIVMFLFTGAMSIGPESIAGEKERGTIATLLVTPVKRREIAIGKVLALSVLTLFSAASSFLGIMLSLPKMLAFDDSVSTSMYAFGDYAMILLVLFSTVFVVVGIIAIISAYAKNLKEATSFIMPVYIITILVSISSMFGDGANQNLFMYCLPIYNTVQSLIAILTFEDMGYSFILITVLSNIVYVSFFVYILNKMFNSEKIMFSK